MYIKNLYYKNVGALKELSLKMPFNDNGLPKPVLIVGENGSGKSLLLSNIVDSFYQIAISAYQNALKQDDDNIGQQFFKTISPTQITIGEQYLCAYVEYEHESIPYGYLFKSGVKSFNTFKTETTFGINDNLSWDKENGNDKKANIPNDVAEKIFRNEIVCFFPPDRYEKPSWMGRKYHEALEFEQLQLKENFTGKLYNPVTASNIIDDHLKWLLDVIVDSRPDVIAQIVPQISDGKITQMNTTFSMNNVNQANLQLLGQARTNIESIMSTILGSTVEFALNYRNSKGSRFCLMDKQSKKVIVPSLDSLSTGQLALFNLFSTIIRYADNNDINKGIKIQDIKGIIAIDEVELHLHSKLQRDVLPRLIRRFPNVQFIVTSHSPLFALGMRQVFKDDGFEIFQMPNGEQITAERFSEFEKAFSYMTETQKFQDTVDKQVSQAVADAVGNALIITEGVSDWKHFKAAREKLKEIPENQDLFIDYDFYEYTETMGDKILLDLCRKRAKLPNNRPMIFIADNDVIDVKKEMSGTNGSNYKSWGNNVFSLVLPVPTHRQSTPNICVEHLYTDSEIKTEIEINGIIRRLYIGFEFKKNGTSSELDKTCENRRKCGENSISIIEGSEGERVTGISKDEETNFALSKMIFADKVLLREKPFDNFDFTNFIPIFKTIKEILECSNATEVAEDLK